MYCPEAFRQSDRHHLLGLIQAYPLADLCYSANGDLVLEYLPLILDSVSLGGADAELPQLIGHVARANPVWQLAQHQPVLIGFHGPQAYISPSAYASKQKNGKVVPTWNYLRVQARATIQLVEDTDETLAIVERMTNHFERGINPPWQVSDAPKAYIDAMLNAIVGVRFTILSLEGKWKIGQNHSQENQATLKAYLLSLATPEADALAAAMK